MKLIEENDKYTVADELDFVAWIASNGMSDRNGKIKNNEEIDADGIPKKARSCYQRMQFLRKYAEQWQTRMLPEDWDSLSRGVVIAYIYNIAIPTVSSLREVQLGDLV